MNDLGTHPNLALPLETFRFSIEAAAMMVLPPYKGAVFRGALINVFRRLVCAVPRTDCTECLLQQRCLFAKIFEPTFGAGFPDAAKYSNPPRPYVINPPSDSRQAFHPGEPLSFDLVLLGYAIDALPYFVYSVIEMGRRGIGRESGRQRKSWGRFQLSRVDRLQGGEACTVYDSYSQSLKSVPADVPRTSDNSYPAANQITLNLLTPLRLKVKNKLATSLTFPVFFKHLHERILLLAQLYGDPDQLPHLPTLETIAQEVETTSEDLFWYEWERYSTRQKEHHKFGGLKGNISFSGNLTPFMPYLKMGELVNVGSNATFGQGRYEVQHTCR